MRRSAVAIAIAAVVGASACASSSSAGIATDSAGAVAPGHLQIQWDTVVRGLSSPISVTNAGDGSGRLFVDEQAGVIRIVRSGQLLASPYLDISGEVPSGGEQGMLSIAFHPHFAKHPSLYAPYTRADGASSFRPSTPRRLGRTTSRHRPRSTSCSSRMPARRTTTADRSSSATTATSTSRPATVAGRRRPVRADRHAQQPQRQDPADQRQQVLRREALLHPGEQPYAHSKKYRREIIAWGLRNPWRVSYRQPDRHVVDRRCRAGRLRGDRPRRRARRARLRLVVQGGPHDLQRRQVRRSAYDRTRSQVIPHNPGGNCALVGGYVYRGKQYESIAGGLYIYTDNCSGRVWGLRHVGGRWANAQIGSISGGPSGFGLSQSGELYARRPSTASCTERASASAS